MPIYFIFIPIGLLILLYSFIGWRLFGPMQLVYPYKLYVWSGLFATASLPAISIFLLIGRIEGTLSDFIAWLAYLSLGFASILFFFLIAKDLALLGGKLFSKIHVLTQPRETQPIIQSTLGENGESRRQLLWTSVNLAVLGMTGIMTGCGVVQARQRIQTEKVTIPLNNLSKEFEGFRIVQISDIHVGPTIKQDYVQEIVDQVNAMKPDLIVLTGDLVDGSVDYLSKDVDPLNDLNSPHGKFFVTGNHEYYSGVFAWLQKCKELGFDNLVNEHRVISRNGSYLVIGGVTDFRAESMVPEHKTDPVASLAGAPETGAKILLAHQPVSVYKAAKAGYDLQLSGHTHGGQYFPFSKLIRFAQPFVAGLHQYENTWLYVNRGTGYWGPPIRLGAPSEITEITLMTA